MVLLRLRSIGNLTILDVISNKTQLECHHVRAVSVYVFVQVQSATLLVLHDPLLFRHSVPYSEAVSWDIRLAPFYLLVTRENDLYIS